MKELIYLAVPYSHPNAKVRHTRFEAANRAAAQIMAGGQYVFSPISHTHPIALAGDLPLGWAFWEGYDCLMLKACTQLTVLMLDGWQESRGVNAELCIARELGLPIAYMEPEVQL